MRKILTLFAMLLMTVAVVAQSNSVISYQAVVRDGQNRLVTNEEVTVVVNVLDASDVVQYDETEQVETNSNGLISFVVGDGNPTSFAAINWEGAKFKTTVTVNSTGYEVTNTIPVTSVPTALYAADVNPDGATAQAIRSALIDTAAAIRSAMPTVNDAILSIVAGSTELGTFTANSAANTTIDIAPAFAELLTAIADLNALVAELRDDLANIQDNLPVPTVIITGTDNVTASQANVHLNVGSAGTVTITEIGLCYNTTGAPSISNTKIALEGTSAGSYTRLLSSLNAGTTYYVRAYITTAANGTFYGNEVTFTTPTPSFEITTNYSSDMLIACDGAIEVTYTAELTNETIADYTLQWYVNDAAQTGATSVTFTCSHNIPGEYNVKCVATRSGSTLEATKLTKAVDPSTIDIIKVHEGNAGEDWGKVEILVAPITTASWKLNGTEIGTWTGKTDILPVGTYEVTLANNEGCSLTENFSIRTSPVCIATAINSTIETTYTLDGQQYVKTIKDHENNVYNVAQIGNLCWTRENMRAVTSPTTGSYLINSEYSQGANKSASWVNCDSVTNSMYGVLYNYCAAADIYNSNLSEISNGNNTTATAYPQAVPQAGHRGICPEGWHISSVAEFNALKAEASKSGDLCIGDWNTSSESGSPGDANYANRNRLGFSAFATGMYENGRGCSTQYLGKYSLFWTTVKVDHNNDTHKMVGVGPYNATGYHEQRLYNHVKVSVRCVRNN
jgi:uncharacterized protein (TIGR02145 family)